jgi:hypothetical protein
MSFPPTYLNENCFVPGRIDRIIFDEVHEEIRIVRIITFCKRFDDLKYMKQHVWD